MDFSKYIPNILTVLICIIVIVLTVYFNGCNKPEEKSNITVTDTQTTPSISVNIEEMPSGSAEGKSVNIKGDVYHSSLGNLWSTDPGETISRTESIKYTDGQNPSVDVGPDGVITSKTGGSSFTSMSGSWGIFDTIWSNIKKFLWLGVLVFAGLMLLYFLVPAAQPVVSGIFRAVASIFPVIGSLVERIFAGLNWKKPLVETVVGIQKIKDYIQSKDDMTQEQKDDICKNINILLETTQDINSQKTIKTIKVQENL